MKFAPLGAFGAMAFTVGRYGIASLGPLAKLIVTFYVTSILFVLIVMGGVARLAGFGIIRFSVLYKRRDPAGAGDQFFGDSAAHF